MNPNPSSFSADIEAEAALWAARLEGGTLTDADQHALDTWLAASPAHRAALSAYRDLSADLELELPALIAAGRIAPPPAAPRRTRSFKIFTLSGLAAAAALAFTFKFLAHDSAPAPQSFTTTSAQRQTITLAEGTQVELNARTRLVVELTSTERRVRLSAGEAFFQVSKDASRPFIVETPAGTVRVTGTTFNVQASSASALDVTVVEGSVQVRPQATAGGDPKAAPAALLVGDHLEARAETGVVIKKLSTAALADSLAWRQGVIVFDDVPLGVALASFAYYHDLGITATPAAAQLRISSRFPLDDLAGFFASIAELKPVLISRDSKGAYTVDLRATGTR